MGNDGMWQKSIFQKDPFIACGIFGVFSFGPGSPPEWATSKNRREE
jgi:hypothetical protein